MKLHFRKKKIRQPLKEIYHALYLSSEPLWKVRDLKLTQRMYALEDYIFHICYKDPLLKRKR